MSSTNAASLTNMLNPAPVSPPSNSQIPSSSLNLVLNQQPAPPPPTISTIPLTVTNTISTVPTTNTSSTFRTFTNVSTLSVINELDLQLLKSNAIQSEQLVVLVFEYLRVLTFCTVPDVQDNAAIDTPKFDEQSKFGSSSRKPDSKEKKKRKSATASQPTLSSKVQSQILSSKRQLELEAYSAIVTAFKAQGELTWKKENILQDLRAILKVSDERHKMELKRAEETLVQSQLIPLTSHK
jgi:hypothetical protein